MKTSKTTRLYDSFPTLYRERTMTLAQSQMAWGFQCDDGWYDLVWDLSEQLSSDPSLAVNEIRADKGELLVSLTNPSPEATDAVEHTRLKSKFTCELCGHAPAYLLTHPDFRDKVVCGHCMRRGKRRPHNKNFKSRLHGNPPAEVIIRKR